MTLREYILSTPFDALVPELIKIDEPVQENLYAFKEAYDILRRMKPAGPQEESILVTIHNMDEDAPKAPLEQRIYAQHCCGDFWENDLAKEIVIEEGIPTFLALAEILWEMTFYGFDPYPLEEIPLNRYEKKAEELENRQFDNYARAKRGVLRGHLTQYALTPEEWEVYEHRFEHKNRAKRMRDARQERAIKHYERIGKIEKAIGRILACTSDVSHKDLNYLFDAKAIYEYEFFSRASKDEDRVAYLRDSFAYNHFDYSTFTQAEILICASHKHPLSIIETEELRLLLLKRFNTLKTRISTGNKKIEDPSDLWVYVIVVST
jgi:hypothetical protein